jgi:hypothetical protein
MIVHTTAAAAGAVELTDTRVLAAAAVVAAALSMQAMITVAYTALLTSVLHQEDHHRCVLRRCNINHLLCITCDGTC